MTDLPLSGIKVIDFTGVQAGPACTQMLAWFGADVLKVERTSGGDVTRGQLRDIPDVDALYFTMLNSNKRSLAINTKSPEGLEVMEKLIRDRKSTRLNSSHSSISYAVFCLKKKKKENNKHPKISTQIY